MHNIALLRAIESNFTQKACKESFELLVKLYYAEYTDATELEPEAYNSLLFWFDLIFPEGEVEGLTFDDLVKRPKSMPVGSDWTE